MISIIIPVHNASQSIQACLTALQNQQNPPGQYEIIVVDDGSTDDTAHIACNAGVQLISQQKQGPAAARNAGLAQAAGEIVCFTDADCVPAPNWLHEITAPLLADETITAVKGAYITHQKQLFARFVQIEYEEKYDQLLAHDTISFMDFYSAACRRQALIDIGQFDERYPNSEDRELSYRLAAAGHIMVFQPTAVVSHHHADTFWRYFRKKIANGYWTAQAVRQFPERIVNDTYTPPTQKIQIALMGLLLPLIALSAILPIVWPAALLVGLVFWASTLPFARKAWQKDQTVALLSPWLLAVRAAALGIGYGWGMARPIS